MVGQEVSENIFLRNDLTEIERLAKTVAEFGKRNNLSGEVMYDVRLALEEVVSNIIRYGFEDDYGHQISIQIHLQGEILTLQIKDDGKPFNPLEVKSTNLEKPFDEREEGGMGVYIVRRLMDELKYKRAEGNNVLLLRKNLAIRAENKKF
jgi:anti-sigma regulatory factor (Ser/Thr protein kinase)